MTDQEIIEMMVEGGKARPGPTTAPKLAPFKLNLGEVFKEINEKTKEFDGMEVPIKLIIDKKTTQYTIKIGMPPVSSLVRKELGLKKLAPEKKDEKSEETEEAEEPEKKNKAKRKEMLAKEKKELKEESKTKTEKIIIANLTIDQCIKITKMKKDGLLAKTMKGALKEVVGSCVSMPVTIEGKPPKLILEDIDKGKYDDRLQ